MKGPGVVFRGGHGSIMVGGNGVDVGVKHVLLKPHVEMVGKSVGEHDDKGGGRWGLGEYCHWACLC